MWTEITDLVIFRKKLLKFLQGVPGLRLLMGNQLSAPDTLNSIQNGLTSDVLLTQMFLIANILISKFTMLTWSERCEYLNSG